MITKDVDEESEVVDRYMELLDGIRQVDLMLIEAIDFDKGYDPRSIQDKISFVNSLPTASKDLLVKQFREHQLGKIEQLFERQSIELFLNEWQS